MRRLTTLLVGFLLLICTSVLVLVSSEPGLRLVAALATQLSGDRLRFSAVEGRLLGPIRIGSVLWQAPGKQIAVHGLELDWHPAALGQKHLQIETLRVQHLQINSKSDEPAQAPGSLALPLTIQLETLQISRLDYNNQLQLHDISVRLSSDGRQHRVDELHLSSADVTLNATGEIAVDAPFTLKTRAELAGQLAERPLKLDLQADGTLAEIALRAQALAGIEGDAQATLTPFAAQPVRAASIRLRNIDPAAWHGAAPQARLRLQADLAPQEAGWIARWQIDNPQAAPIDQQGLPFSRGRGELRWLAGKWQLPEFALELPGGGKLAGQGTWQQPDTGTSKLVLALRAQAVDTARIHSQLRPSRLQGTITGELAAAAQSVHFALKDGPWTLSGQLEHVDAAVNARQIEIFNGPARLQLDGRYQLEQQRFELSGFVRNFDPAQFIATPTARLNAAFGAAGQWTGKMPPDLEASLIIDDSRLFDAPLSAQLHTQVRWPQITDLQLALEHGRTRLHANGALGEPGDRLQIRIDAPQLAPQVLPAGIAARLQGNIALSGPLSQVRLQADLQAQRWMPGERPNDGEQLQLKLRGEWQDAAWRGEIEELRLDAKPATRNIRLRQPAPLKITRDHWQLGPLLLTGAPLDWQASLTAQASTRQLSARLQAQGARIGQIHGELAASMAGKPWQLASDQAWQGSLDAAIGDLGWLGELLNEDWQTAGQVEARLKLGGTPQQPRLDGQFNGRQLGLHLRPQGLQLVAGQLRAKLEDNLLRIDELRLRSINQPPPKALRQALGQTNANFPDTGSLEISGEMRVDRNQPEGAAALDFRLQNLAAWQQADQWISLSGAGKLTWQKNTLGLRGELGMDAGYWQLAPAGMPRLSDDVVILRPGQSASGTLRPELDLDLQTDLGEHFHFSGAGLRTRLVGKVRLTAKGRDLPRASGSIRTRDGQFSAYGQQLSIERGVLRFQGLPDNPALDVRAVRKGLSVEPGVQISGTAQRPVVRLISDPELPDHEKLSWLVFGHGSSSVGSADIGVLLGAAGGLLGNDAGGVLQQLKQNFGLDEFGVRQGNLDGSGLRQSGSRIIGGQSGSAIDTQAATGRQILSIGKRLSSNATLSYEQSLSTAEGIVKLAIALTRNLTLVGRAGTDNAVDLFYTITWGEPPRRAARETRAQSREEAPE